jgi:two-component system alkaline phosphatase synthesis response regulator PhoP
MQNKIRVLLVEDEEHLQEALKLNLELEGYTVSVSGNGKEALTIFSEERFNLVILDVILPVLDGFSVCWAIRLTDTRVPILFLTAKDTTADKIQGLRIGADDYLTKPFNLEEFLLRVKKLINRSMTAQGQQLQADVFNFDGNEVNFSNYEVKTFRGEKILLTKKEAGLLKLLIDRKNEVVSRESILETVWGYDIYPSTRTIDNFILAFRKYFEKDQHKPTFFVSVRGVGYKFTDK